MLLEYSLPVRKAWERAKVGLQNVEDECLVDLAELSREPLEVDMASMDDGRRLKNQGGEVRKRMASCRHGFMVSRLYIQ